MRVPSSTNAPGRGARSLFNRGRGGLRGSGYGAPRDGGLRSGWRNSGAPYVRPFRDSLRGGTQRVSGSQPGGRPTQDNSLCIVCKTAEGRYKFRCCSRRFCSTSCYKNHVETPCGGVAEPQVPHQGAAPPSAPGSSQIAQQNLLDDTASGTTDALIGPNVGGSESTLDAADYNQQISSTLDGVGPPLSATAEEALSADSETESGEASSDDSDVSQSDKPEKWGNPQQRRAYERKFEPLSSSEQEIIRMLSTKPEMQSSALQGAIRSVVTAASQSPRAGSLALSNLMQHPDFAAFANSLMDALYPESAASNAMQLSTLDQHATQRHLAEAASRPN